MFNIVNPKKIICIWMVLFLLIPSGNIFSEETKKDTLAIDVALDTAALVGLYVLSDFPNALGGLGLYGGLLGSKNNKEVVQIISMSLYNFTLAPEKKRNEVFLVNLAIWGLIEVLYPKPETEEALGWQILPELSGDGVGISVTARL